MNRDHALVSRLVESLLYGVSPVDATTYALTVALMLSEAVWLFSSYVVASNVYPR